MGFGTTLALSRSSKNMVARVALTATLVLLLLGAAARADWTIDSSESQASTSAGVERRHVVVSAPASGGEATIELALFSTKSVSVRVVDNPSGDELGSVAKRIRLFA